MRFKRNLGDHGPPTGSPGETQFGGPGEGFREGLLVVGRLWRHGLEVGRLDVGGWLGVWDGVVGGWQTLEAWSGGLAGGWRGWWLESGKLEIGGLETRALDARPEAGGLHNLLYDTCMILIVILTLQLI